MLALFTMLFGATFLSLGIAQVAIARANAAAAADMAALAGASHPLDACGWAERIAARNRAMLTECAVVGDDVAVTVAVTAPSIVAALGLRSLHAQALAGPEDSFE